jgi:hypothetical protein
MYPIRATRVALPYVHSVMSNLFQRISTMSRLSKMARI